MPYLQFDTSAAMTGGEKRSFAAEVTERYAAVMGTTTDHVAVSVWERADADLHLGREDPGPVLFLDAHVRRGRSAERRREFALAVMDAARAHWKIPKRNMKVVFTEHDGDQMMGYDRVGDERTADEED
ncbi:4-oxalocrotonate tautomerase family protein [Halobium palmae]|uniref:4-oxalocrotonate tautomerase family protein n=1 Tax=Halobium palmae TaxID=1776492 RepID=A0ABD5S4W6_9EURY